MFNGILGNGIDASASEVGPSPPLRPVAAIVTGPAGSEDVGVASRTGSVPSTASSSRRTRNTTHLADDEFAFEIGSSLLTEVRRLRTLLDERDKTIQEMKHEKDDLAKRVKDLITDLQTQEISADKYKEESWNLKATLRELGTQLHDAQMTGQTVESEHKRAVKQLGAARDAVDWHKNEVKRLTIRLAEVEAKHETGVGRVLENDGDGDGDDGSEWVTI